MANLLTASIEEKLWHSMRGDLAQYDPGFAANRLLMCCCCGRCLPRENFDLEHIIPQQALKTDPIAVRDDLDTPANIRAGNLLLCRKPLKVANGVVHENGCNSWKGRFYDRAIRELVSGSWQPNRATPTHTIAALCLGYLAMVSRFGYRVALMPSGVMMREQFFMPLKFHRNLLAINRVLMLGGINATLDNPMWKSPFAFEIDGNGCLVVARNFAIRVPCTNDPRLPVARHLSFAPPQHKALRPDFRSYFR